MDQLSNIALFKQRLNDDPNDVSAAIQLGNIYFDQQEAASSIVYYQIALAIKPDQAGILTDLGTMYWANGNLSYSEKSFRTAIEVSPGFGNAHINLGHLTHQAKGDLEGAKEIWQSFIDKHPESPAVDHARELLEITVN